MSEQNQLSDMDSILAGIDFSRALQDAKQTHRREMRATLLSFLEIVDSLMVLEQHVTNTYGKQGPNPSRAVSLTVKQALKALAQAGVAPIECTGHPLDLTTQEVVEVREDTYIQEDMVIEEILRGYLWQGEVLRQAKVVVSHNKQPGVMGHEGEKR